MRARGGDESARLSARENPCRANLARGVWDETSPPGTRRSKPSRAWETLRAEHRQVVGTLPMMWTAGTDVAKKEQDPREGAHRSWSMGGSETATYSEEEAKLTRG